MVSAALFFPPGTHLGTAPAAQAEIKSEHPVRILVVEDHPFLRKEMIALINSQHDFLCCGEVESIASTAAEVAACRPDIVLLDLRLKDGDAFGLINSLTSKFQKLLILVISQSDETLYAERVVLAGARGFLMKQEAPADLLIALRTVIGGKIYLSRAMSARLLERVLKPGSGFTQLGQPGAFPG